MRAFVFACVRACVRACELACVGLAYYGQELFTSQQDLIVTLDSLYDIKKDLL